MKLAEKRQIAIGAAKSKLRQNNWTITFENCLEVLNELYYVNPNLIASQWYVNASDNQFNLMEREVNAWIKSRTDI